MLVSREPREGGVVLLFKPRLLTLAIGPKAGLLCAAMLGLLGAVDEG